jgi:hypothetical protein
MRAVKRLYCGVCVVCVCFVVGCSPGTQAEMSLRQEEVTALLGRLDGVDVAAREWDWLAWAESQMQEGTRCFLDGDTLREQNVADYVSRLGESPAGDLCWIYSTSIGLYPGNSLNGVGADGPADVYETDFYRHVPQLAEQFSRIVLARFLKAPEFQKRYVRTMLWARIRFWGRSTGLDMQVLLDRYTQIKPSYFDPKGPYANQRLLGWAVTLYLTSETAGLERLSLENASEMFARWRDELPDRRLYLELTSSKTRWTYGKTRHHRSHLPDIERPKTPSVQGALSSYPSAKELINEGILGVGLQCWKLD